MNGQVHVFDIDVDALRNQNGQDPLSKKNQKPAKNQFKFKITNFDDRFVVKIYGTQKPGEAMEASETQVFLNEGTPIYLSLDQLPNVFSQEIQTHKQNN